MNEYYKLLQVSEDATDEEIESSYRALKEKYGEERWQDGEAGNAAARMLEKLDVAYEEIMRARREARQTTDGTDAFGEVADFIRKGDLAGAQTKLDSFNERSAEWHYLQSVVFYKKNWINESKKQLEIAMQMEPSNQKYRADYEKLSSRAEYKTQTGGAPNTNVDPAAGQDQMGGNECINMCNACFCLNCLCNCMYCCR